MSKEKYKVIYADVPWSYQDKCHAGKRGAGYKYPTMSIQDIKDLSVGKIADDNSFLFMWVTFPLLQEGLNVIKSWGFTYKTIGFNWIKLNKKAKTLFWAMGNYSRSNSELCLLAVKGKPKRVSASVHSVVQSPIEAHSKKPDEVRDRIVKLCGDVKRIELFGRKEVDRWNVIGDGVSGKDIREELNTLIGEIDA